MERGREGGKMTEGIEAKNRGSRGAGSTGGRKEEGGRAGGLEGGRAGGRTEGGKEGEPEMLKKILYG